MVIGGFLGTLILAYALGSIPFGLLLTKLCGIHNLRDIGSGNIGATNVARTGRKGLAVLTLILDASKGALAVYAASYAYGSDVAPLAGLFAVLGHIFPVWLQFKGGKGVATTLGVLTMINPMLGASICALWLLSFAFSKISSLSALISIGYSSIAAYLLDTYLTALLCLCLAGLIIFTHRNNIARLLEGTEGSFKRKAT